MTEKDLRAVLSKNIKRYRSIRHMSQAELAEELDISINFLSNIENGNRWISDKTLVRFASSFNIEPYELFVPEEIIQPKAATVIEKYTDEAVVSVTQALLNIRDYYLKQSNSQGTKR